MRTILVLSANPKNTNKLRLDEEIRDIQAALEKARNRDQFVIVTRPALRVDGLIHELLSVKPQIVHFSGHGVGEEGLVLENQSGQAQPVSTEALAGLFKLFENQIECVVLNACYSKIQAEAIHQHIDCVIGMNSAIGDRAAISFANGFYTALSSGRSYSDAYQFGCTAVQLQGIPESLTPVLLSRMVSQAVPTSEGAETKGTSKKPLEESSTTIIGGDYSKQIGSIRSAENINM